MQKSIIFAFLILLSFSTNAQSQKIEVKDGITYIHNKKPQWGKEPKIKIEFIQEIGGIDVKDKSYVMSEIKDLFRDKKGNLFIIDFGNHTIKKFDKDGKFIKNYGRKGQGPGEFLFPTSINVDHDENIYVLDYLVRKIIILNSYGEEIKRFTLNNFYESFRLFSENNLILMISDNRASGKEEITLFSIFNCDGKILKAFAKPLISPIKGGVNIDPAVKYEIDKNYNIICTYEYINKIEKFDNSGNIIFSLNRPVNYRIEEEFKKYIKKGKQYQTNVVSRGIGIDYKDRIWVTTFLKQPPPILFENKSELLFSWQGTKKEYAVFEIFSRDGILICSIPQPCDIFYWRMFGDRLFIVDENMVSVKEYKIVDLEQ